MAQSTRIALGALIYFLTLLVAGFALGTVRVLVLVPVLGEAAGVALELPVMLSLSWLIAARLGRSRFGPESDLARLGMGGLALSMLVCSETGLAVLLFGQTFCAFLDGLTTPAGLLGLAGQIVSGLIPWLQHRAAQK